MRHLPQGPADEQLVDGLLGTEYDRVTGPHGHDLLANERICDALLHDAQLGPLWHRYSVRDGVEPARLGQIEVSRRPRERGLQLPALDGTDPRQSHGRRPPRAVREVPGDPRDRRVEGDG